MRFATLSFGILALACSSKHTSDFGNDGATDSGDMFSDDSGILTGGDAGDSGSWCMPDVGNFEVPGNGCDDDNDGIIDNVPVCDSNLPVTGDGFQFAKTLGLCNQISSAQDKKWGVIQATYTRGYNNMMPPDPNQHGLLGKFGNVIKPREGVTLGILSSGWAREYDNCGIMNGPFKGGCAMIGPGAAPPGFPKPAMGCPISMSINDVSTIHLQIKVPNNAKGFQFDFNFMSGEWPEWVCTTFNDAFIAYLKSSAFNNGMPDNISFDAKKNPVSVNNGFFDRCSPKNAKVGCSGSNPSTNACAGGDAELQGSGFYDPGPYCNPMSSGGGTGWLTTSAPVKQGEIMTIDFMVWDTGDEIYDSSVILDKFVWQAGPTTVDTTRPPN